MYASLKGGLALDFRLRERARTTKDLDLARQDDEAAATDDLLAVQAVDLGDYFAFAIQRSAKLDALLDGAAVRYHAAAEVAGRPFDGVTADVGFGTPRVVPDLLEGPDLLSFAGIAPILVPAIPIEQHLAEKVHAYTRTYRNGRPSSRVKDLIDLVLIRATTVVAAGRLRHSLGATFESRASHALPTALPPPPATWAVTYHQLAGEVGLDQDLRRGYALAASFLAPILDGSLSDAARWEPVEGHWTSLSQ